MQEPDKANFQGRGVKGQLRFENTSSATAPRRRRPWRQLPEASAAFLFESFSYSSPFRIMLESQSKVLKC